MKKTTSKEQKGSGFNSPDAVRRMREIEDEVRKVSIVKVPTIVVVTDATEESLEGAVVFIKAGTSSHDAVSRAAENGIRNAHERACIPLPPDFDATDNGLYWDQPYIF